MTFRPQKLPLAGFVCAVLLTGGLINTPSNAANSLFEALDPPVFLTNLSGNPVELQWQTVVANLALSPLRGTSVPVDVKETPADEGLFWFHDPSTGNAVENTVFVSIVGSDGTILAQKVMEEEIAGTLSTVEDTALQITIETDGALTLSIRHAD
ncbi:MAG: hypothetical protein AAGA12_15455 [Pseudomonadota bacterium]